jgi:hypothetical protein
MRHIERAALARELEEYLNEAQRQVEGGHDVEEAWKRSRGSASMKKVAEVLASMTGTRERCMYCEDSRATDIDHFWPKARYVTKLFRWDNLLWICSGCNRCKLNRFPLDDLGRPLLVDPTLDEPWSFLFYDSETDELAPRWDLSTEAESAKGVHTLSIVHTLTHQAVAEGRKRTRRNIQRAVRAYMNSSRHDAAAAEELLEAMDDNDGYGLIEWFFVREGRRESPFLELHREWRDIWAQVLSHRKLTTPDADKS